MQTELLHLPAMAANLTEGPLSVLDVTGHEQLLGLLDRILQLAKPHIAELHLYGITHRFTLLWQHESST